MDGQVGGWVDGWLGDGWVGRCMGGQTDRWSKFWEPTIGL